MTAPSRPEVVIVGGGISGLVAAFELTGGAEGPSPSSPQVTIIEAAGGVGGKLGSTTIGSGALDAGADGVLARRPEVIDLCHELGIDDELRPIAASGASVYARGRLRPLPEDLQLGIPTSWRSLRRSGVLSPVGLARALVDVVAPRPASRSKLQDRTIGGLIETKLGAEVVTTLVDPMIGGIVAGRVADMSAAAVFPPLLDAAQQRGGLMAALRTQAAAAIPGPTVEGSDETPPAEPGPAFVTLVGGMHTLPEHLEALLEERGVRFVTGVEVTALRRAIGGRAGWSVDSETTTTHADGVVLATPAPATARLLRPHDAEAASLLDQLTYSTVGVITFVFDEGSLDLPAHGTGVLVPPGTPIPSGDAAGSRFLTTALTFLDRKWPHLARPETTLLRASVGRIDDPRMDAMTDDELVTATLEELRLLLGDVPVPREATVTRWPKSLPQYKVNHLLRVGGIESGVERLGAVAVCGAAYRGVGVPACVASGRSAGRRILEAVTTDR